MQASIAPMHRIWVLPMLLSAACASSPSSKATGVPAAAASDGRGIASGHGDGQQASDGDSTRAFGHPAADDPQDGTPLPESATFLNLLQAVAGRTTTADCALLDRRGRLHVGVREGLGTQGWPQTPERLPAPWLDDAMSSTDRLRVVTPWGLVGEAAQTSAPALVAVSDVPPTAMIAPAGALLLETATRAALYFTDAPPQVIASPDGLGAALSQPRPALGSFWVAAVAGTPARVVAEHMRQVPTGVPVGFAIALPRGTRLPESTQAETTGEAARAAAGDAHCPRGLPAPDAGDSEGSLPKTALQAGVAPLEQSATGCLRQAVGRAAAGGRLVLALRIGARGQVRHSCLVDDPIGDATLAACVTEHARLLRFAPPDPAGFVDVQLPIALRPQTAPPPRPYCSR